MNVGLFILVFSIPVTPEDLQRFPPCEYADVVRDGLKAIIRVCEEMEKEDRPHFATAWRIEKERVEEYLKPWESLYQARCFERNDARPGMLFHLNQLREIIGHRAFYQGKMPPVIP
jgi:hypothetical protein